MTTRDAVMDHVEQFVACKGFSPTVRELAAAVGLSSTSTVHAHLSALKAEGRLTWDASKPRTIRPARRAA